MMHVLHMNTLNSAINQPLYNYSSTLQQQLIATEQNRVLVMTSFSSSTGYGILKNVRKKRYLSDC